MVIKTVSGPGETCLCCDIKVKVTRFEALISDESLSEDCLLFLLASEYMRYVLIKVAVHGVWLISQDFFLLSVSLLMTFKTREYKKNIIFFEKTTQD